MTFVILENVLDHRHTNNEGEWE